MSHKNRIWFVSLENESTSQAVLDIADFDINTDFERDLVVHEKLDGDYGEIKLRKNLARMPSYEGIRLLEAHRLSKGLKFKVYVQESPGAKIVRWVGNIKPKAKMKAKVVPASSII